MGKPAGAAERKSSSRIPEDGESSAQTNADGNGGQRIRRLGGIRKLPIIT